MPPLSLHKYCVICDLKPAEYQQFAVLTIGAKPAGAVLDDADAG